MKAETIAAFVAIAATTVSATWHGAAPFKCPTKAPELCIPKQEGGFDFSDLIPGKFEHHNGFDFTGGWECKDSFGGRKRDQLLPRTFRPKCITADVSDRKESCPKIVAGSDGPKKFAIKKFQVSVEYDCDLEFHYTMPNKSICKQKSRCKKSGTEIENKQCGGATDVVIVMPKAPKEIKKKTCKIGLHKIDFSCGKPEEVPSKTPIDTKPVETPAETKPVETSPVPTPTGDVVTPPVCEEEVSKVPTCAVSCISAGGASLGCAENDYACLCANEAALPGVIGLCVVSACPDVPAVLASTKAVCQCIAKPPTETPVESTPAESTPAESTPAESSPAESTPAESTPVESTPVESTPAESTPAESSAVEATTPAESSAVEATTPVESTPAESSAVEATTENSPAETTPAPEQPQITLTTVVVEETITTCPVTATHINGNTTSIETSLTVSTISITSTKTITTCAGGCTKATSNGPAPTGPSYPITSEESNSPVPTSPATPDYPTGPAPPVLPSCLNTWLPEECESNSDVACFCPKPDFTKDVYECLAAHGATQEEIDSAVEYFQGLCAPFVPVNPGIITDCPERPEEAPAVTKPAGPVTTIIVDTIITVPCVPEVGTITTSSSVSTIKTQVTVPQVILTTITGGEVGVVPGTATAPPAVIASTTANAAQPTAPAPAPYPTAPVEVPAEGCEGAECPGAVPTTLAPVPVLPSGTGGSVGTVRPVPTAPVFTGAATQERVGAGLLAAVLGFAMLI